MVDVIWTPVISRYSSIAWHAPFVSPSPGILYGLSREGTLDQVEIFKSVDNGATWAMLDARGGTVLAMSWYYDQWTEDDEGTLIHVVYGDGGGGNDGTWHFTLDTADDSISADVQVDANAFIAGDFDVRHVSIIKKNDGNLAIIGRYDSLLTDFVHYRSIDGGATWVARANPYDGNGDRALATPGYEVDPADYIISYHDIDAGEITYKTFDNSLNSWSETAVVTSIVGYHADTVFWDVMQRWANQGSFQANWNDFDTATADLEGWMITGNATAGYVFTATALIEENLNESDFAGVCVDQQNDHIYVIYQEGGTLFSSTTTKSRRSIDGGVSWEADVTLTEDAADDMRFVQLTGSINNAGGEIQGDWYNDDTRNLLTNVNTATSIPAVVPPTPPSPGGIAMYGSPIAIVPDAPFYASPIDRETTTLPQYGQIHVNRTGFPTYGQIRIEQDGSPTFGQEIVKLT